MSESGGAVVDGDGGERRQGRGLFVAVLFVVGSVAFLAALSLLQRPAETPRVFLEGVAIQEAVAEGAAVGKPVFAVVTADWCGPCQAYKRGALADAEVQRVLEAGYVSVMIDSDEQPESAMALGAGAIPATFVLRDGEVVGGFTGARSAEEVLELLDENS